MAKYPSEDVDAASTMVQSGKARSNTSSVKHHHDAVVTSSSSELMMGAGWLSDSQSVNDDFLSSTPPVDMYF
jgi:hypothetical protein